MDEEAKERYAAIISDLMRSIDFLRAAGRDSAPLGSIPDAPSDEDGRER